MPHIPTPSAMTEKASVDLRRLRYFISVCDHGGFTKAAEVVGIAQPALTRQIRLLEDEVGQPLLERTGRGARPSQPGLFLLSRSRGLLEGLDEALRELRAAFASPGGPLTLGICPSIAPFLLDELIEYVARRHPNVTLSIFKAYSGDLKRLMRAEKLDIALTYSGAAPRAYCGVDLLCERLVLVSGVAAATVARTSLREAARMKLILPSRIHELRAIIDRVARKREVILTPDIELDSLDAVKRVLLEAPDGRCTILPFRSVQAEVEAGALEAAAFSDPEMRRTIALMTPRKPRNAEAAAPIRAWIVERMRSLAAARPATDAKPGAIVGILRPRTREVTSP